MLIDLFGGKKIIGVDIFLPNDLKKRLNSHNKLANKIKLIEGSSTDEKTIKSIKKIVKNSKKTISYFRLSSYEDHVLQELEIYSNLSKREIISFVEIRLLILFLSRNIDQDLGGQKITLILL